jgi:IrrE N-terminal-like domain
VKNRVQTDGKGADAIVERLGLKAPIDPLAIVRSEKPFLRAGGADFGDRYDGMLEYHESKNRFLLFYNTKYDAETPPGRMHSRTRFTIGHELGHYFINHHRAYLMRRNSPHVSRGEFLTDVVIEKEADSFAASVIMPTRLARPMVNQAELSMDRIDTIAKHFQASLVSATFRCVSLSDFPCAVAVIRDGEVAWIFPSEPIIKAGIYPNKGLLPENAGEPWTDFHSGLRDVSENEGLVRDWFNTYEKHELRKIPVTEEYIPVTRMGTLLVLLTLDESDLFPDEEDECEDD